MTEFKDIDNDSLLQPLSEKELVKIVKEISTNFTKDRSKIGKYIKQEDFVSAYSWFYLPTNKPKLGYFFDSLSEEVLDLILSSNFIDYGCGPGTYSWALIDYFKENGGFGESLYLVDSSKIMLQQARKIHAFEYSDVPIVNYLSKVPDNSVENPFLFFGNSLNEMDLSEVKKVISGISPNIIGFIEPGTKETFKDILKLREYLISNDYSVIYPCNSSDNCPVANKDDWCHQVSLPDYPDSVLRKCQLTSLDRRSLPMTAHLYVKKSLIETEDSNRDQSTIFRFLGESKGSVIFEICRNSEKNEIVKIEAVKRGLSKKEIKELKTLTPGKRVEFKQTKVLGDGTLRVEDLRTLD
jgi:ribosomal protein RSM22 (predicted rRNA methylase)